VTPEDNCTINGTISQPCPRCTSGSSKKGLLGLLGLLGLIPLLLLLSSSSLLCLLLLRRKRSSDVFYPVGTQIAAPSLVMGTADVFTLDPCAPPLAIFQPPFATPAPIAPIGTFSAAPVPTFGAHPHVGTFGSIPILP